MRDRPLQQNRTARTRELGRILSTAPPLARFVERCQIHAAIERELRARLPVHLAKHCLSCVAHPERLVVFTDSATLATPLRFAVAAVLPALKPLFAADWKVARIRIFPTWQPDRRLRELGRPPSGTVDQLAAAAAFAPGAELHDALLRLAATLRSRP